MGLTGSPRFLSPLCSKVQRPDVIVDPLLRISEPINFDNPKVERAWGSRFPGGIPQGDGQ